MKRAALSFDNTALSLHVTALGFRPTISQTYPSARGDQSSVVGFGFSSFPSVCSTSSFRGAHHATFPLSLAKRAVAAGIHVITPEELIGLVAHGGAV
ncbi:hypothetical protein A5780_08715 [Nocardia sp. 852002-20019_SCH5090214]|nr:hypothetical protein A5780_08715 [Nocardia sp. 852002-20019_SCH5090214]